MPAESKVLWELQRFQGGAGGLFTVPYPHSALWPLSLKEARKRSERSLSLSLLHLGLLHALPSSPESRVARDLCLGSGPGRLEFPARVTGYAQGNTRPENRSLPAAGRRRRVSGARARR